MKRILSNRQRSTLHALFETLRPTLMAPPATLSTDALVAGLEDYLSIADPFLRMGFPLMLNLLEYGTLPFAGMLRPFRKLSAREREAYLRGWHESTLSARRDVFRALRALCSIVYYGSPQVLQEIHYDHETFARAMRESRFTRFGDEIARREAEIQGVSHNTTHYQHFDA